MTSPATHSLPPTSSPCRGTSTATPSPRRGPACLASVRIKIPEASASRADDSEHMRRARMRVESHEVPLSVPVVSRIVQQVVNIVRVAESKFVAGESEPPGLGVVRIEAYHDEYDVRL